MFIQLSSSSLRSFSLSTPEASSIFRVSKNVSFSCLQTPEVETPIDPSEIIPEDTLHERLALPNFKELKSGYRWESDAGQDVVKKLIDAINCLVCPTLLNEGTDRVFGQYAIKEGSSGSLSRSICDYVREQFVKITMSPGAPSKEKTPEFLAWVKDQCCDNVEIAIRGNVGEDRSDSSTDQAFLSECSSSHSSLVFAT